jgi:threonine dehydrogenase-like Zn-dependent dehydrogenase
VTDRQFIIAAIMHVQMHMQVPAQAVVAVIRKYLRLELATKHLSASSAITNGKTYKRSVWPSTWARQMAFTGGTEAARIRN